MKKLVRDRIPEIFPAGTYHRASDFEYKELLDAKLHEEVREFLNASTPEHKKEELADILEVLDAIYAHHTLDTSEILVIKEKKKSERGAFKNKVVLD